VSRASCPRIEGGTPSTRADETSATRASPTPGIRMISDRVTTIRPRLNQAKLALFRRMARARSDAVRRSWRGHSVPISRPPIGFVLHSRLCNPLRPTASSLPAANWLCFADSFIRSRPFNPTCRTSPQSDLSDESEINNPQSQGSQPRIGFVSHNPSPDPRSLTPELALFCTPRHLTPDPRSLTPDPWRIFDFEHGHRPIWSPRHPACLGHRTIY